MAQYGDLSIAHLVDYNIKAMDIQKIKVAMTGTILIFGILFLLGKTSLILNPHSRKMYFDSYISKLRSDKSIDAAAFWEYRDFYSSESSNFSSDAILKGEPFLTFDAPMIQSKDYLLPGKLLSPSTSVIPLGAEVLIRTDRELVYVNGNKLVLKFTKTIDEMKKVNGFFSHFGIDLEKYNDRQWYNETSVTN